MTFIKITEQESLYNDLEKKSVMELLTEINAEDRKVALAVERTIPEIDKLVTGIVERMRRGGRLFYLGAGTSGRLGVLDASEIPPTFGMPNTYVIGLIAGGDSALRNPVEAAEDDLDKGWEDLMEYKINVDDVPEAAAKEKIEAIPALLLYKGGEVVDSIVAPDSKAKIEEFIEKNL